MLPCSTTTNFHIRNSGTTLSFLHWLFFKEVSSTTGFERQVQRTQVVLPSSPNIEAYWMWNEHGMNFVLYDIQSSVDIELAFMSGNLIVDLSKCTSRLPYTIDFSRMEQTRHGYNTRRRIQRCPLLRGTSLQSLLALAPGITGSTGLMSGSGGVTTYGTSGGFPPVPGYGYGSFLTPAPVMMNPATSTPSLPTGQVHKSGMVPTPAPTPVMMNPVTPTPSLPTGHVGKSGMAGGLAGFTGGGLIRPPPSTKSLAVLGATGPPLTSHGIRPPSASTAVPSRPGTVPQTTLPPPATSVTSRSTSSPQKRRRRSKPSSKVGGPSSSSSSSSSSVSAAGSSSKEKTKSKRRTNKEKKAMASSTGLDDDAAKYARRKKKLKSGEDGVSRMCVATCRGEFCWIAKLRSNQHKITVSAGSIKIMGEQ